MIQTIEWRIIGVYDRKNYRIKYNESSQLQNRIKVLKKENLI